MFIVFLPGLFFTGFKKNDKIIWPLSNEEKLKIILKSKTPDSIISDLTFPSVSLFLTNKNSQLIKLISEKFNYHVFLYDWRQSFDYNTFKFKEEFDNLEIKESRVTFIAYSAGGIIAYKYLNEIKSDSENFRKVKKCISIGCPLNGCLKSLSTIIGYGSYPKTFLTCDIFKSFFELIPYDLSILFPGEISSIFNKLKFLSCNETNFIDGFKFRKNFNNIVLENNDIDYLYIIGLAPDIPMCVGFDNSFYPIYDYGCGDGVVLFKEALPTFKEKHRVRYVLGKHTVLTELDSVLDIIGKELTEEEFFSQVIFARQVFYSKGKLYFSLHLFRKNIETKILKFSFDKLIFTHKTKVTLLNKLDSNKGLFSFKTSFTSGTLQIKNMIVDKILLKDVSVNITLNNG